MLDVEKLKNELKDGIHNIVIPAIDELIKISSPYQGSQNDEKAKTMADAFDDLVSEQLAEVFANAIDYYVKNMAITGTIITVGNSFTQKAKVISMPTPMLNGQVPNTLGIS